LTDLLGINVDVVPASMLKPRLRDEVLAEPIPVEGLSPAVTPQGYSRPDG